MNRVTVRPAEVLRRADAGLRESIGEHEQRVADLELGVADLAAGRVHPPRFSFAPNARLPNSIASPAFSISM